MSVMSLLWCSMACKVAKIRTNVQKQGHDNICAHTNYIRILATTKLRITQNVNEFMQAIKTFFTLLAFHFHVGASWNKFNETKIVFLVKVVRVRCWFM